MEATLETKRLTYLDGWRGLAITIVMLGHFSPLPDRLGGFGVELFFVLSGRLMAHILFIDRMPLPRFFQRRFARIYPALLAFVLAMAALTLVAMVAGVERGIDSTSAVGALTFTINYFPASGIEVSGTLQHIWSLAIEEHSYVLLALLAFLGIPRLVVPVCLGLAALAMANGARLYFGGVGDIHEIYWRTDVRLAPIFLSAGMYLLTRNVRAPWLGVMAAVASLPLFLALPLPLTYIMPTILLAFAVNTIDTAPQRVIELLSWRLLVWLGSISYSLYLWQQFYYKMAGGMLMIVPAVATAILSWRLVEIPARKAINRWRIPTARPAEQAL